MSQGWISLHRKIKGHWLYNTKEPYDHLHAWIDILLSVNHEDSKTLFDGQLILVKAGQMITSLSKLSEKWGWNDRSKTRRFLELLQSDGMVDLRRNKHGTLVTVANWAFYQGRETQMKHSRNTGETLLSTNNNDNNDNNTYVVVNAREVELAKVMTHYMDNIASVPSPTVTEGVLSFLEIMESDAIIAAINTALGEGKRNWSYINGILRNWRDNGVKNMADVARIQDERERRNASRGSCASDKHESYSETNGSGDRWGNLGTTKL